MAEPRNPLFVTPITVNQCVVNPFTLRTPTLVVPVVGVAPTWRVSGAGQEEVVSDLVISGMKNRGFVTMKTWTDGLAAQASDYVARLGTRTGEVWDAKLNAVLCSGFDTAEREWRESIPKMALNDSPGWVLVVWASQMTLAPENLGAELQRGMDEERIIGAMVPVRWSPLPTPQ